MDGNFKIVDAAYPHVARRLLAKPSPLLEAALWEMLLDDCSPRRLRWDRLIPLFDAFLPSERLPTNVVPDSHSVRDVMGMLMSQRGAPFIQALVLDLSDAAENLLSTANVVASLVSGGLVPPPSSKPSLQNLDIMLPVLSTLSSIAAGSLARNASDGPEDMNGGKGGGGRGGGGEFSPSRGHEKTAQWQSGGTHVTEREGMMESGGSAEALEWLLRLDSETQQTATALSKKVLMGVVQEMTQRNAERVAADSLQRLVQLLQDLQPSHHASRT